MPRAVVPIRASEEEHARWKRAAEDAGLKFSAWARKALNEASELDLALKRQSQDDAKKVEQKRTTAFREVGTKKSYQPDWRT